MTLTVVTPVPIVLGSVQRFGTQFVFSYSADVGLRYAVERSATLSNWTTIWSDTAKRQSNDLHRLCHESDELLSGHAIPQSLTDGVIRLGRFPFTRNVGGDGNGVTLTATTDVLGLVDTRVACCSVP